MKGYEALIEQAARLAAETRALLQHYHDSFEEGPLKNQKEIRAISARVSKLEQPSDHMRDEMWALRKAAVSWLGHHGDVEFTANLHAALVAWLNHRSGHDETLEYLAKRALLYGGPDPGHENSYLEALGDACRAYYEAHS